MSYRSCIIGALACMSFACQSAEDTTEASAQAGETKGAALVGKYTTVSLTADVSTLDSGDRRVLELLIEAAQAMDDAFWKQSEGDKRRLLGAISEPALRQSLIGSQGNMWIFIERPISGTILAVAGLLILLPLIKLLINKIKNA